MIVFLRYGYTWDQTAAGGEGNDGEKKQKQTTPYIPAAADMETQIPDYYLFPDRYCSLCCTAAISSGQECIHADDLQRRNTGPSFL